MEACEGTVAPQGEELLRGGGELQARVREAVSSYEGDRSDEQALFDATLGKIAAGVGLPISYADALALAAASGRRELSDAESRPWPAEASGRTTARWYRIANGYNSIDFLGQCLGACQHWQAASL